jgi:tRNA 2-thiouridine synthesizing protein A
MANNLALVSSADSTDSTHFDRELDARGLSCPLPFLNTRKSVESLESGEVLKVISTDKGCVSFFESLVRQTGLELLSWHEKDGEFRFFLRKN